MTAPVDRSACFIEGPDPSAPRVDPSHVTPDTLRLLQLVLLPACATVPVAGGAVIVDWRRTRFLGVTAADLETFATGDGCGHDEILSDLVSSGCAAPRRRDSFAHVGAWLRVVHILIRVLGFGRMIRILPMIAPPYMRSDSPSSERLAWLKRSIESCGDRSLIVSGDCKTEALTAFILLRRSGLEATLHVGVRDSPLAACLDVVRIGVHS